MKRLRFLHIPKTAGSTFTLILERLYRGKKIFSFTGNNPEDIKRYEALPTDERMQIELFTGHAPIVSGIPDADNATIITFLREPVSRVISFCQHVAEGKSPYLRRNFPSVSFDLDSFLNSGNIQRELSNLQTKMLINHGRFAAPDMLEKMSAIEARDKALDNLFNKIAWFGLQDFFDEGLVHFSMVWGLSDPLYYFSKNKRKFHIRLKFEARHLQQIEELNAIDIEVYRHAKQRIITLLNSPGFDRDKLRKFKRLNLLAAPLLYFQSEFQGKLQKLGASTQGG